MMCSLMKRACAIYDSMLKKQSNQGTEQNSSSNTSHSNTSSQHTEKQNENRAKCFYSKPKIDNAHTTNMGGNKTTKNSEASTEDTASTSAQNVFIQHKKGIKESI